jgi:DNA-binding CsgD family transcriptional regulator
MRTVDLDGPSALSWIIPEIPKLLRSDIGCAFTIREKNDDVAIGSFHTVGLHFDVHRTMEEHLGRAARISRQPPVGWTLNVTRPEPRQRNRVFDLAALERLTGHPRSRYFLSDLFQNVGMALPEHLRVAVCDGGSLLAYVGAFQQDDFTAHQKTALAAVVPALQKRLGFERLVGSGGRQAAALEAALEAIGRPAFVVSAQSTIHELNTSARELLTRANVEVRRSLRDALARRPTRHAFDLTPLRIAGGPACQLAVLRHLTAEPSHAAIAAAARWGLTPRRREVLEMVVRGMTNATIAAEMRISERAVEQHVTAIFDRAGVENRAALVASVLRG